MSTRTSLYVLEISVAGDPSSLLQGGLPSTAVLLLPDCKDGIFIAEELKGYTPEDLKPAMIIAGITDCNQAFEKSKLRLNLVITLPGLHWRNSWHTVLHCDFNGANTVQSKGCALCVVCGGKYNIIFCLDLARRTTSGW